MADRSTSAHAPDGQDTPTYVARLKLFGVGACGAVATVFFWYIPLSPLIGGTIAGYLHEGDEEDAKRAGMVAGLLVPLIVLLVAGNVFLLGGGNIFGQWPFSPPVMALVVLGSLVYSTGVSTIGGHIGGTIMEDEDHWEATVFDE